MTLPGLRAIWWDTAYFDGLVSWYGRHCSAFLNVVWSYSPVGVVVQPFPSIPRSPFSYPASPHPPHPTRAVVPRILTAWLFKPPFANLPLRWHYLPDFAHY